MKKVLNSYLLPIMDVLSSENFENENLTYLRRLKKPMIEKKRRDRINKSLACLKTILLENIRKNGGTQTSKLDKADILEMTVNYLRMLQHSHSTMLNTYTSKYSTGYTDCAREAQRYLSEVRCYGNDVTSRLSNHLSHTQAILETITNYSVPDKQVNGKNSNLPLTVKIPNIDIQTEFESPVYVNPNEFVRNGSFNDVCARSLVSCSSGYISQSAVDSSDTSSVCSPHNIQHMEHSPTSDRSNSPSDVWRPW